MEVSRTGLILMASVSVLVSKVPATTTPLIPRCCSSSYDRISEADFMLCSVLYNVLMIKGYISAWRIKVFLQILTQYFSFFSLYTIILQLVKSYWLLFARLFAQKRLGEGAHLLVLA